MAMETDGEEDDFPYPEEDDLHDVYTDYEDCAEPSPQVRRVSLSSLWPECDAVGTTGQPHAASSPSATSTGGFFNDGIRLSEMFANVADNEGPPFQPPRTEHDDTAALV